MMNSLQKKEGFQGQHAIVVPSTVLNSVCKKHPVVSQLYITDIGYYPHAKHHYRQRPGGSKEHIIIYCVNGKGKAQIENHTYAVSAGDFILLPANVTHEYAADENSPWTIYWIHFKGTSSINFTNMMQQKMGSPVFAVSYQDSRVNLFEEIYTNLERGYSIDNICYASVALQYFLASCCFDSNYNYSAEKNKNDSIEVCIKYIQKNIDKKLTVDDIARVVNLSPSHFTTIFKKRTGFTLIEYINQLKTQKACQYLMFTDLRVNEIAVKLGMEDPYYFTRMFTKIIGVSPAKYRMKRDSVSHSG